MRNIFKMVLVVVFGSALVGCVTMPDLPKNLAERSTKFVEGKTTYSEVIQELGTPRGAALLAQGEKVISYVDGYYGGTRLDMHFGKNDVLESKLIVKF